MGASIVALAFVGRDPQTINDTASLFGGIEGSDVGYGPGIGIASILSLVGIVFGILAFTQRVKAPPPVQYVQAPPPYTY